jgi:hypothetical protein
LVLTLMLAACAATGPSPVQPGPVARSSEQPALIEGMAAELPRSLQGFEWQDAKPAPGADGGWVIRYRHQPSGSVAAVFLRQPRGEQPLPDGPASPAVQLEVTAHALAVQVLLGAAGPLTRVPDYGAGPAGGPSPLVRCADLRFAEPEAVVRRELACSSGVGGAMVTVMLSARHGLAEMDQARRFLTAFAVAMVLDLREQAPPAGASPETIPAPGPGGPLFRV